MFVTTRDTIVTIVTIYMGLCLFVTIIVAIVPTIVTIVSTIVAIMSPFVAM